MDIKAKRFRKDLFLCINIFCFVALHDRMEKYHRTCRYSRKNKHRHRDKRRYHGYSANTIKTARRRKSTYNRRVLKDEVSHVHKKRPDLFYGEELGYVSVDCECQGWDENGYLICNTYECQAIPNAQPVSCLYKSTARKHYDYRGIFKPKGHRRKKKNNTYL